MSGGHGRVAEPWLLVLTSLADGPKHGYAIMTDVAAFSAVSMEPGALYRALSQLQRRGWIRPLDAAGRRRRYEIAAAWPGPGGPCAAPRLTGSHRIQYNLVSGTD